jgi:hypothetical protein
MPEQKGELIATKKNYVLRHTENNSQNIVTSVDVTSLDLTANNRYFVVVKGNNGPKGNSKIGSFSASTDKYGSNITIPIDFIKQKEQMKPGKTVDIRFHREIEATNLNDPAEVLGRAEVVEDTTVSDNCDARLTCEPVSDYLGEKYGVIRFRNTRTQQECEAQTHSTYESDNNAVSFPKEIRSQIDARPGDLIELIGPADSSPDATDDKDVEELIREMHGMMMEMYNDYLEAQND